MFRVDRTVEYWSHESGNQHPIQWPGRIRERKVYDDRRLLRNPLPDRRAPYVVKGGQMQRDLIRFHVREAENAVMSGIGSCHE